MSPRRIFEQINRRSGRLVDVDRRTRNGTEALFARPVGQPRANWHRARRMALRNSDRRRVRPVQIRCLCQWDMAFQRGCTGIQSERRYIRGHPASRFQARRTSRLRWDPGTPAPHWNNFLRASRSNLSRVVESNTIELASSAVAFCACQHLNSMLSPLREPGRVASTRFPHQVTVSI